MKLFRPILAGLILVVSLSALAADCASIFSSVNSWLAADNHLVRVVTTLSSPNNEVTYTRGFLSPEGTTSGSLTARSIRYTNSVTAADGSPFSSTSSDVVNLTLIPSSNNGAQLNYIAEAPGGTSIGYAMTCMDDNMMYILAANGILTLSLRFDAI